MKVFNQGCSTVYFEIVKQSLKQEGSMVYLEIRKYCLNRGGLCHFGSLGFLEIIKHSLNRSSLWFTYHTVHFFNYRGGLWFTWKS